MIVLLLLPVQNSPGQKQSDIGIIGGIAYYMGDLNHYRHFYAPGPSAGLILRYNFNPRNSIRISGNYGLLKGSPEDFSQPYPNSSQEAFSTGVVDVGLSTEFNFMPYKATKVRKYRYTPYVVGGLGYTVVPGGDSSPSLSFGGGFKYNLTRRMSGGLEWSFRKTFSDELDHVQNIGFENNVFFHNKDWFSIVGVFITYKFFDWGLDCAAYE